MVQSKMFEQGFELTSSWMIHQSFDVIHQLRYDPVGHLYTGLLGVVVPDAFELPGRIF